MHLLCQPLPSALPSIRDNHLGSILEVVITLTIRSNFSHDPSLCNNLFGLWFNFHSNCHETSPCINSFCTFSRPCSHKIYYDWLLTFIDASTFYITIGGKKVITIYSSKSIIPTPICYSPHSPVVQGKKINMDKFCSYFNK